MEKKKYTAMMNTKYKGMIKIANLLLLIAIFLVSAFALPSIIPSFPPPLPRLNRINITAVDFNNTIFYYID